MIELSRWPALVLAAGLALIAFRAGERRGAAVQSAKEKADADRVKACLEGGGDEATLVRVQR